MQVIKNIVKIRVNAKKIYHENEETKYLINEKELEKICHY